MPDPLYRRDAQQIKHQAGENAPFGDCHGSPGTRRLFLEHDLRIDETVYPGKPAATPRHSGAGFPDRALADDSIETAVVLTRMARRAKPARP
jgi:hypothetical protein